MVTGVKKRILYRIKPFRSLSGKLFWQCIALHMTVIGFGKTPAGAFEMCQWLNGKGTAKWPIGKS